MPVGEYYQKYGPVHRRRSQSGNADNGEPPRRDENDEKKSSKSHARRKNPLADEGREAPRPRREHIPDSDGVVSPTPARTRQQREQAAESGAVRSRSRRSSPLLRPFSLRQFLMVLLIAVLTAPLILPYAIHLLYINRAIPGVSIQGVPLGNLDRQSIQTIVAARHLTFTRHPLTLSYKGQVWNPSLEELGVTIDPQQIADTAFMTGKHGGPLTRWQELVMLVQDGIDSAPQLVIDEPQLQTYLLGIAEEFEYSPRDAELSVAGGVVNGTPGVTGRQVLVDETAHEIVVALQTLTAQEVTIRSRDLPPAIDDQDLQVAQVQAQHLLTPTMVLTHRDQIYRWEPEKLAELVHIDAGDEQLKVEIDQEQLAEAVEGLAQRVDSGSVEPRLGFQDGALQIVAAGREGWRIKQKKAVERIIAALQSTTTTRRTVALPIENLYPGITASNLDDLGIVELVAEGKSSFAGSADYRITNIKAGAAHLDGVLIAPGEEFSFNTQIGDINAENGFVEGYAVIGNRTQLEWGGGICQDSTTVFRAAFWAGLPITERHAHPFYISWYDRFAYGPYGDGPGMDATIYTGISDLKFVNDTGNWLLMQTEIDEANQVFTVQLYGTKPDRTVRFDGPYISNEVPAPSTPVYVEDASRPAGTVFQSDVARQGRDIVVHRIIEKDGVEVESTAFFTRFKPWPNVFVRGTGEGE